MEMTEDFVLHERLAADCITLADWPLSRVLLMNDASYPYASDSQQPLALAEGQCAATAPGIEGPVAARRVGDLAHDDQLAAERAGGRPGGARPRERSLVWKWSPRADSNCGR